MNPEHLKDLATYRLAGAVKTLVNDALMDHLTIPARLRLIAEASAECEAEFARIEARLVSAQSLSVAA